MQATADSTVQPVPLQIDDASAFWVVWSPRGGPPRRKHSSESAAITEAQRLSALRPGRHFYVLACRGYAMQGPEVPTEKQAARAAKQIESGATSATTQQGRREMDTPVSDTVTATSITQVIAKRGSTRLLKRT